MRGALAIGVLAAGGLAVGVWACGGREAPNVIAHATPSVSPPPPTAVRLPRAPGAFAPSLLAVTDMPGHVPGASPPGEMLADVDSCSTCHPDAAAQWASSAHSFASFGNPIYRANVEVARRDLGRHASNHCGGCHDMPLMMDGLMAHDVPPADVRAHSGVTCRLCHGVKSVTTDGNGSYVWSAKPIEAPDVADVVSVARHKAQVGVGSLGTELCVGCHRAFLSPDLGAGMPVHLAGLDEPGAWRNSAWTGNGMARVDQVKPATCIDCHMEREQASPGEYGAKHGTIASHRFLGGQTWMAAMRGDTDHLHRLQTKLAGIASIDISGALVDGTAPPFGAAAGRGQAPTVDGTAPPFGAAAGRGQAPTVDGTAPPFGAAAGRGQAPTVDGAAPPIGAAAGRGQAPTVDGTWTLPADGAPVVPGTRLALDVVIRNLLVGHRFPGGVLDIQDTWVEVEVADRAGTPLATSGLAHATDAHDDDAHVLRTLAVDDAGNVLEQHQLPGFRAQIATQTIAPRDAEVVRYAFDVPRGLTAAQLPLTVTARLRHRSRTLQLQAVVCEAARTPIGRAFAAGAKGARDVELDPCRPQPITLIAETHVQIGAGAVVSAARAPWERMYEHGMALTATVTERLDEARTVLEAALAAAPVGVPGVRPRAMILVQLATVASRQGRADDALGLLAGARALLPAPGPAALDEIAADALARVWRWREALAPAETATHKAPANTLAWIMLARVRASLGDDAGALVAATSGLALSPRDADLLRTQATALAAMHRPEAVAALAAYERFRAPDNAGALRIACAKSSPRCAREREQGHTHELTAVR